mmetsp:Transcript_70596/g.155704  ORF Transcript_70596/g.155704 Transcript_70596/m.155704 type:complete len:208 (+) Transcript_70596:377-1000(+)
MLLDGGAEATQLLLVGIRRAVLELHANVGDSSKPELSLRQAPGGELVILHAEAAAVDSDLLGAHGALVERNLTHHHLALAVLIEKHLGHALLMSLQLEVHHRGGGDILVIHHIAGHESSPGLRCSLQGFTGDAEGWKQTLCHKSNGSRDIQYPSRPFLLSPSLILRADPEVVAGAMRKEGNLEDLYIGQCRIVAALELTIPNQHEGR